MKTSPQQAGSQRVGDASSGKNKKVASKAKRIPGAIVNYLKKTL